MAVPPEVPIVKFFSPSKNDRGLIEFHNSTLASYQPLDLSVAHPNTREYSGYKLGKQFNLPNDHKWIVRIWVTDQTDPTWWNWAEKFSSDSNSHPIFIREYREPRKTYAPLTKGQPLKSVYKLTLATAGTGYIPGTLPALTFTNTGTGGTGAAGHAVVNPDGTIAHLVLDDGGDGYNTAPTFTIEAPPSGTTATGTAVIHPAAALLVAEEAQQFPDDSEFRGLYLNVVRVYETLPGPTIPYTRFDNNLGPVQGTRQAVLWANQVAAITATAKTTYDARDQSSIVAWKIVEAWSDGTGSAGNPAYPILKTDFNDPDRGPIHQVSQITTDTTSVGSSSASGGTVTTIRYEPYQENPNLRKKIIETWSVPRSLDGQEITSDFGGGTLDVLRTRGAGQTVDEGLLVVASSVADVGDGTQQKISKVADEDWPTLYGTEFDPRFGVLYDIEKKYVDAGTTGSVDELSVTEVQPYDKWRSIRVIGTVPELPPDQVWYGTRNHSFPDELLDFALVGTEEMSVEFNIRDGYSGPVKARFTRSFSNGPPTAQPEPTIFLPQAFYKYVEYSASRSSTNTSSSTSTGTSEHSATNESTNQSSGTHSSSSDSQTDSTTSAETSHTDTSESEGTDSGTSSSTNTAQDTHSSQGTSQTSGNGTSASTSDSHTYSETTTGGDSGGGVVNSVILSDSTSLGESSGTNEGTQNNTSSSEGTSENSSTSEGAHESTSQSNRISSGESTSSGTSQNSTTGTSSGNSESTTNNSGTSSGTSQSSDTHEGTSETTSTGISSLRIVIPKTLRAAMSSSNLGVTVDIPATTPTALPHGEWIIVDSTSDHWRFGVWVTELIEILVP